MTHYYPTRRSSDLILLEERILGRDPQREDAVEPSLDRRQLVEQGAVLIDELQTGDDLELLEADARELARVEKVIPLGQGLAGVAAFEIIGRIEQVLAARLALAARERAEHVEAASDGADEPQFALDVGRVGAEHLRHRLAFGRANL